MLLFICKNILYKRHGWSEEEVECYTFTSVERRKQFSGSRSVLLGILKDSNGGVEKERMNKELWPCEMRVLLR
jgi:hypothetical protein